MKIMRTAEIQMLNEDIVIAEVKFLQFKQLQINLKKIWGLQLDSKPWPLRLCCSALDNIYLLT